MEQTQETTTTVTETTQQPDVAVETDEDYRWLTERLDAHTTELRENRKLMQAQLEALREANRTALEESKTLIQSLTEMVTSQNQTLSTITASLAMSQLTPQISVTSLPEVEATETATEVVEPENHEATRENREEREPERRKRRKL